MQIGKEVLYLSRADVMKTGLTMKDTIDIIEQAHRDKGNGNVHMPPKLTLQPHDDLFMIGLGCAVNHTGAAAE